MPREICCSVSTGQPLLERPAADAAEHVSYEEELHRAPPAGTGSRAAEPRSAGA